MFKDLFQLGNPVEHRGIVITPLLTVPLRVTLHLTVAWPFALIFRHVIDILRLLAA